MTSYFQWADPRALAWLWLIPVLGLLLWRAIRLRLRAAREFCPEEPDRRLHLRPLNERLVVKGGLGLLAVGLLVVALARPQVGLRRERAQRKGADIILVMDTSLSMRAQDMQPSRLEAAKAAAFTLVSRLPSDRFGIVVFAGDAQLYCPLTVDHDAVTMFLDSVETGSSPRPGTDLTGAIGVAAQALGESEGKHRALVIMSDGEDHGTGAVPEAEKAVRQTAARIEVLGFGSAEGEPIPEVDPQGHSAGLKHDSQGQVVLSRLGEAELQQIAEVGKGSYHRALDRGAVDDLAGRLEAMEGAQVGTVVYSAYGDRFQWPLGIAILLLAIEAVMADRSRRQLRERGTA